MSREILVIKQAVPLKHFFSPYLVWECLELAESAVRMAVAKMNEKQITMVKNSDVKDIDFRKLNNR